MATRISGNPAALRKHAEDLLSRADREESLPEEFRKLLHELSVHQIELEIQNEELRIAHEEAETARERYFQLYDLAPIGYAGFERSGKIADINLTGSAILGVERRSLMGRLFAVFVDPGDQKAFDDCLGRAFRTRKKETCTIALLRRGLTPVTIQIEAVIPEFPNSPRVCRIAFFDVTEQKNTERKLTETSRYLATLIDSATSPIVVWDPDHRITIFNDGFERLTGRSAGSVIGRPVEILFPEDMRNRSMEIIREADRDTCEGMEIPVITEAGIKEVLWNAVALRDAEGKWTATVAQGRDISGLKKNERELREKIGELDAANTRLIAMSNDLRKNKEQLTESLAEKEVLLAEIHHRVKNNLASFISLISLDGAYEDTPRGRQLRDDLQNRARTMALIHETLYRTGQFSRVNMEEYLATLVSQVAGSHKSVIPVETRVDARGVTLDIGRAMPVGLIANELLTNALKYAWPEKFDCEQIRGGPPFISVQLAKDENGYLLAVRDNGIGLSESINPAKAATLGLKLVNFIARHQLRAVPVVNRESGTEFLFRIPSAIEES